MSEYAETALQCWNSLPNHCPSVELAAFIVMPNHVHGIVVIKDMETGLKPASKPIKRHSLPEIVRIFKTSSSRRINGMRNTSGIPVWQRDYWEHVIRNQEVFNRIHEYILTNPQRWHLDKENPSHTGEDDFDLWLNSGAGL